MRSTSTSGSRDDGPSSDSRTTLEDLVEEEPGQSLLDAARTLDLHVSTVSYHARRLEEEGRIQLVRDGRCVRMFPKGNGLSSKERALITALQSPRARDVLDFLADSPGVTKTEAAQDLGLSVKGLGWHVDRLEDLGVVRVDGDRRGYSLKLEDGVEKLLSRVDT